MDLATLGFGIDSTPLTKASQELHQFQDAAHGADDAAQGLVETTEKAGKATDAMAKEVEKAAQKYDAIIESLNRERELLNSSAEEKRALNEIRKAGVDATSEEAENIRALVTAIEEEKKVQAEAAVAAKAAADAASQAAKAREDETKILKDYSQKFKDVMDDLKHEHTLIGKTATEKRKLNEIRRAGVDATSDEARAIEKAVDAIERENKAVEKSEGLKTKLKLAVAGLAAAITTGFIMGLSGSVARLETERVSLEKYEAALRTMGAETEITGQKFKEFADELELRTGRVSQEVLNLGANLASFGFTDEVFKRSIELANDMSAAWGGDLRQNLEGLARALDDPIKGFAMLRQRGISLTDQQDAMVKKFMEANDKISAQGVVFEALEQQVKGVAEAGFTGLSAAYSGVIKSTQIFFDTIATNLGLLTALEVTLNIIAGLIQLMTENLELSIPVMVVAGATLAMIFGPTVIASIQSVATWIGVQMVKSILAMNAALLANPLAIFITAIIAVIAYMIDWQASISGLIKIWGAFVYAWNSFWGNEAGAQRGIEIIVNADRATEEIRAAAEDFHAKITGGFQGGGDDAAKKIEDAMKRGGSDAANRLKNGMVEGSEAAAKAQAQAAIAAYEEANGKLAEIIVKSHQTGAEYIYNSYTGAVKEAAGQANKQTGDTIVNSSKTGGDYMGESIRSAGASMGNSLYSQLATLGDVWVSSLQKTIGDLIGERLAAENSKIRAETEKLRNEAQKVNAEKNAIQSGGSGSSSGSSGSSGSSSSSGGLLSGGINLINNGGYRTATSGYASGGEFTVGGHGGTDSQLVQFLATPGERVSVDNQHATPEKTENKISVVNVWDPQDMTAAMGTADGTQVLLNFAKANRDELAAILGRG